MFTQTQAQPQQKQSQWESVQPDPTGIPPAMKTQFERMSGLSFDDVRVHYNSGRPAQLQALAYTQGSDVYVAPGQERHLGHELGHIVQQKQGRVAATARIAGVPLNDDPALEAQADHYAHMAVQRKAAPGRTRQTTGPNAAGGVVQRAGPYEPYEPGNYADAKQYELGAETNSLISAQRIPPPPSTILRLALILDGDVAPPSDNNQAHHIVESSNDWGRAILEYVGIDPNSAVNGVFLPTYETARSRNATVHRGSHTREYRQCVNMALQAAINQVPSFPIEQIYICAVRHSIINRLCRIREVLLTQNVSLNRSADGTYDPATGGTVTIAHIFSAARLFD